MSITELFTQFIGRPEPTPVKATKVELEIEENEIAEEIEVEDEEVNAVNDHLSEVIKGKQGKFELPTSILSQFNTVQTLSLDAWAASTLRGYRG